MVPMTSGRLAAAVLTSDNTHLSIVSRAVPNGVQRRREAAPPGPSGMIFTMNCRSSLQLIRSQIRRH